MASAQSSTESTVPRLMSAVQQLTPSQLRDFKRRFAAWQNENGGHADDEAALVEACRARLSPADERRLKALIGKSERRALQAHELDEYRTLVHRSERIDAMRLAAMAKLARVWRKPLSEVMRTVGWESGDAAATRHPANAAKSRTRSRR